MNENPYNSPSDVACGVTREDGYCVGERSGRRPLGVSILAVFNLIGGTLVSYGLACFFLAVGMAPQALNELRIEHVLPVAIMAGAAVILLASAIGMWSGAKWGWWLEAFIWIWGVVQGLSGMLTVGFVTGGLQAVPLNPESSLPRQAGRVVVCALITFYFFQGNVLGYFGLQGLRRLKALGILGGICLVLAVAVTLVAIIPQ